MLTDVTGNALELYRHVPNFLGGTVLGEQLPQCLLLFQGLLEGHTHLEGNQFGHFVRQAVGLVLDPRDVTDDRLRGHGAKCDDLGHRLPPIGLRNVLDHLVPAIHAEINIEVRHRYPLGVQEPLKQQVVGQRVKVSNLKGVGHQGTGARTPTRTNRNPLLFTPPDEIHHHQEITGKAHFIDNAQLIVQALAIPLDGLCRNHIRLFQSVYQALMGYLTQIVLYGCALGDREIRQTRLSQGYGDRTSPGYLHGVGDGLGQIAEQVNHFFTRAQILLVGVQPRPPGVIQGAPVANTHSGLMGLELVGRNETHIVGRYHRATRLRSQLDHGMQVVLLAGPACAMHLEVKAVGKRRHPLLQCRPGLLRVPVGKQLAYLAVTTPRQGQHSRGVLIEPFPGHPGGTVVLTLSPGSGNQQGQVPVAGIVHGQQTDWFGPVSVLGIFHPKVDPDQQFQPLALGGFIGLDQAVKISRIGHSDRRHTQLSHFTHQLGNSHQAIDQGKLGVQTQVDKLVHVSTLAEVGWSKQAPDGRKAFSMQWRCTQRRQSRHVLPGRITLVPGKPVAGILTVIGRHLAVPLHLGKNGRRRDGGLQGIAADDRLSFVGPPWQVVTIHQDQIGLLRQRGDGPVHGEQ